MSQNGFGGLGSSPGSALEYKFSDRFTAGKPDKNSLKEARVGDR